MNWGPPIGCSCGGWGSPVHQKKGPPGSCLCHIAKPVPGGSSGTTTDYAAGLKFFAGRGLKQTIGGYYDSRNGTGSATLEVQLAKGIPNITGWMYTTWNNEYRTPRTPHRCGPPVFLQEDNTHKAMTQNDLDFPYVPRRFPNTALS